MHRYSVTQGVSKTEILIISEYKCPARLFRVWWQFHMGKILKFGIRSSALGAVGFKIGVRFLPNL